MQPIVSEETRTIRVPVHVENRDHALKPGMFVSAVIQSALAGDGRAAPTGVEGRFSCPMHPEVLRDQPGKCPTCEMPLEQIPGAAPAIAGYSTTSDAPARYACPMKCEDERTYDAPGKCPACKMNLKLIPAGVGQVLLAVPASAVLDSGTRRLVYVEKSRGLFEAREVLLGPRADDFFPVLKGLVEGERVATRGGFLIDSQFQITGHPSLFYPGGLTGGQADRQQGPASTPASTPAIGTPASAATPNGGPVQHKH